MDWHTVMAKQIPSPWIPNVRDELDTHYFEHYPETTEEGESLNEREQDLFSDF